jgi:hypothetical protein
VTLEALRDLLTWIFQSEVRLRFRMPRVEYLLADVFGHDLVENVVSGYGQDIFVQEEPLGQERVEIMRAHDVVFSLVGAPAEEKSQQLQGLQPDQLALRRQQLEYRPDAVLGVESRDHRRRMFRHQPDQHLEHVVQILVLVHGRQIVQNALELVVLDAVPDHDQLLQEQQNELPDAVYLLVVGTRPV